MKPEIIRGAVLVVVAALASAACSQRRGTPVALAPPVSAPVRSADDWVTFAHDQFRSGYQPQATGISPGNVSRLTLRWRVETGAPLQASPLVAAGRVYVALSNGTILVLDSSNGKRVWQRETGASIAMTPSLSGGMLYVGDHRAPGDFMALDARTGRTMWKATLAGGVRSEPAIARGIVYVGETGGDAPACRQGGVHAFDARTGRPLWTWVTDPRPHDGGAVWSPISIDRDLAIFGTGNSCDGGNDHSNSVVALDRSGHVAWFVNTAKSDRDSDVGGGASILHQTALITSKNGNLYAIDDGSGAVNWTSPLASAAGYGGIGTPSTDGRTIVVSRGFTNDPTSSGAEPGGALLGFDTNGTLLWTVTTKTPIPGNAPISHGVVFTPLDTNFAALDARTGAQLWSYPDGLDAYPSPAVVPSGVYFADDGGRIFAFSMPRSGANVPTGSRARG